MISRAAAAWGAGAIGVAGLATLGYAAGFEVRSFMVRRADVPILPAGADPIRVLHLSDLHLTPTQRTKLDWIASLSRLQPDLVINTGDNLAHMQSNRPLLAALGPLLEVPGVFVLGSNDYFAPKLRNPVKYLLPDDGVRHIDTPELPWRELKASFTSAGWLDLTNTFGRLSVNGLDLAFVGVDDPHLSYDDLPAVAGPAPTEAAARIGVTHAPYLRVLDQFASDGYDLITAGHTHGGQLCLPGGRALVTNCDLDTARARGLHRHRDAWLHVSAGAGTSPYAPVRFCCRPEATLLTLVPDSAAVG